MVISHWSNQIGQIKNCSSVLYIAEFKNYSSIIELIVHKNGRFKLYVYYTPKYIHLELISRSGYIYRGQINM